MTGNMPNFCTYCMLTGHSRWNCPSLKIEMDDLSSEELEAAGEVYDRIREQEAADARQEGIENR